MKEKIKKLFSDFLKNKKAVLAFLFFVLIGISFPLYNISAQDNPLDFLMGFFNYQPAIAAAFSWTYLVTLSAGLVSFTAIILNHIISPGFSLNQVSYVNPGGNELIKNGLAITQGLANMVLVLVLVVAALAIILRWRDYEAKKILPVFILVALLVNFAPVLCGIIVDASNIVMNYFLSSATGYTILVNALKSAGDAWLTTLGTITSVTFSQQKNNIQYIIMIAFSNFLLFLILLIFAIIFILRHIVIWILVILSPLAFVFYILPYTRNLALMWWKQLVNWAFIGIGAAFFLYLSGLMIDLKIAGKFGESGWLWKTPEGALPYLITTLMLYIGLFVGFKTSALGAGAVIGFVTGYGLSYGKKMAKWATVGPYKRAWQTLKEKQPSWLRARATPVKRWGAEWGKDLSQPRLERWTKRAAGAMLSTITEPFFQARVGRRKILGGEIAQKQAEKILEEDKELEKGNSNTLGQYINSATDDASKLKALRIARKKGIYHETTAAAGISEPEIARLERQARTWLGPRDFRKIFPDFAKRIKEAQERFKGETAEALREAFDATEDVAERIGILAAARDEGELDDMGLTQSEVQALFNAAPAGRPRNTIARMMPHFVGVDPTVEPHDPAAGQDPGNLNIRNNVRIMRPKDIGKMPESAYDRTTLRGRVTMAGLVENMTQEGLLEGTKNLGRRFSEAFEADLDARINGVTVFDRESAIEAANPTLHRAIISNPALAGLINLYP